METQQIINRPSPIHREAFYAHVERGPKRENPNMWYWRIRAKKASNSQGWIGWATETEITERLTRMDTDHAATLVVPTKKKSLKVAVVGNSDYAKGMSKALMDEGHTPYTFPTIDIIPSSVDVVVCRVRATSHASYWVVMEEARRGDRPVIFRKGVKNTVEQVNKVATGTWKQDSILPSWTEEADETDDPVTDEAEKQQRADECEEAILQVVEKGGLFTIALLDVDPDQAKDVLCSITYPNKDRVKRTAASAALMTLQRMRVRTVEEKVASIIEQKHPATTSIFMGVDTEQVVISHDPLSTEQVGQLTSSLTVATSRLYRSTRAQPVPEVEPVVAVPVIPETVIVTESIPEPIVEAPPIVVEPEVVLTPDTEKEIGDCLEMVAHALDTYKITAITPELLAKFGLCIEAGALTLSIVHMASPTGACCNGASTKVSYKSSAVTCKACRQTPIYQYMAWHEANAK